MDFEIGQRVKIVGTQEELEQYSAERGYGHTGIILDIDDATEVTTRVSFEGGIRWFKPEHLEVIPDVGKQSTATPQPPVKYPPLRVLLPDGKPTRTWQSVLDAYSLAASQPHLYFLGSYSYISGSDLHLLVSRQCILMTPQADSERDYFVFVITEE